MDSHEGAVSAKVEDREACFCPMDDGDSDEVAGFEKMDEKMAGRPLGAPPSGSARFRTDRERGRDCCVVGCVRRTRVLV